MLLSALPRRRSQSNHIENLLSALWAWPYVSSCHRTFDQLVVRCITSLPARCRTTYLRQLQLGGPQAPVAQPADMAALVAAPPGADLLSALKAGKGTADAGTSALSAPIAVRANATSPLDDLAAALRRPAAAGLPPAGGAAAFSMSGVGQWNDAAPAAAAAAVSPTATAAAVLQNGGDGDSVKRSCGGGGSSRHGSRGGAGTSAAAGTAGATCHFMHAFVHLRCNLTALDLASSSAFVTVCLRTAAVSGGIN